MSQKTFSLPGTLKIFKRWPYLFFVPLALTAITLGLYTLSIKEYRSSAIILFQSGYIPVEEYFTLLDKLDDRPVTIVRSLLYGEPARTIVHEVWPASRNDEPLTNSLINHLRSLSGISLKFQRDNPQALGISYDSADGLLAYKVVKATISALTSLNQDITDRKISSAIEFLENELIKSNSELALMEQQSIKIKAGLPADFLAEVQRQSAGAAADLGLPTINYDIEKSFAKTLRYENTVPEIEQALNIARQELEQMRKDYAAQNYLDNLEDLEEALGVSNDPEIAKTSGLILDKQQQLSELQSRGFLDQHPDVQTVTREIANLREMKRKRLLQLQQLSSNETSELTKLRLEKLQLKKIDNKTIEVRTLEERLVSARESTRLNEGKTVTLDDRIVELSRRKAELLELENRRIAAAHSYSQMAKRLEVLRREGRIDQKKFGLTVTVAEEPKIPLAPLPFASLPVVLAGVTIVACILFALAAFMTYNDQAIYSKNELFQLLPVPVIGVVDSFKTQAELKQSRLKLKVTAISLLIYAAVVFVYFKF